MISWSAPFLDRLHRFEQQKAHGITCFRGRTADVRCQKHVGKPAITLIDGRLIREYIQTGRKDASGFKCGYLCIVIDDRATRDVDDDGVARQQVNASGVQQARDPRLVR